MRGRVLSALSAVVLLGVGGLLIFEGTRERVVEVPRLETPVSATPHQTPEGPTESEVVVLPEPTSSEPVGPAEAGAAGEAAPQEATERRTVTPETMGPNRLFIPSVGIYAWIDERGSLGTLQEGSGLLLPHPYAITRYRGGATVADTSGTLLLAGHVTGEGVNGALFTLARVRPGNLAYVTDGEGHRQAFQLESAREYTKSSFDSSAGLPDNIWGREGRKQLAVATCGGLKQVEGRWVYTQNTVAIFVPVAQ